MWQEMRDLISEKIEVEFEKKPGPPTVIRWRGQAYKVASCVQKVYDYGFRSFRFDKYGLDWRLRRKRTYYMVTTECGQALEIYHDRARNQWFVLNKLSDPDDPQPPTE